MQAATNQNPVKSSQNSRKKVHLSCDLIDNRCYVMQTSTKTLSVFNV